MQVFGLPEEGIKSHIQGDNKAIVTITAPYLEEAIEATPESILSIVASLPEQSEGCRFAILQRDKQTYMQTLCTQKGFHLEYQEGDISAHYHCVREDITAQEIIETLNDYLAGDQLWKRRFEFEKRDLRTPLFRVGFLLGKFMRRITGFFVSP